MIEKIAPYFSASPPAVVLGFSLYHAVLSVTGVGWEWFAALIALIGVLGMMTTEIYTYRKAAQAIALKQWGAFGLMLAGAMVCSGMIIVAVYSGGDSRSLIGSVVVAVIMYSATGADAYFKELEKEKARKERESKIEASRRRADARVAEAETKKAKLSNAEQKVSEKKEEVTETFGNDWRRVPAEHRAKIAKMTVRQISERYRVSERTALNWQGYAKDGSK